VFVLDDGRIAERGSHDELLAAEGSYADLWSAQMEHGVVANRGSSDR
jgi:ABC-type multidrug transport system fused ATPase/permease subunit